MTLPDLSGLSALPIGLVRSQPSMLRRRPPRAPKLMPEIPHQDAPSQNPSLVSKVVKPIAVTAVVGGVEEVVRGGFRLVSETVSGIVTPKASENMTQEVVNATSTPILKTITDTAQGAAQGAAQGVSSVAGTVFEGTKGLASDVKSIWSWGSWGFRLLPAKIQVALGLTAAIGGFMLLRSFRSGGSTHHYHHNTNINVNGLPQQCKLVTTKNGNDTTISLDCTESEPVHKAQHVPTRFWLRKLHKRLTLANKKPLLLPEELRARVRDMVEELDEAKPTSYRKINITEVFAEANEINNEVTATIQSYMKKIIENWKSQK